jgi:TolB protein
MNIQELRKVLHRCNTTSILEIIDIDSGTRRILDTFDYLIEAPNWSANGNFLLFNSLGLMYRYELATGGLNLIDTGHATDCNNDHVLSPDNRQFAISNFDEHDAQSRIYIVPIEGGSPKLVTENGPSYLHGWSPDGNRLAYCAEREGSYDIYTIDVQGGRESRLTHTPGLDDGPEYSPDGKHIWFNSTRTGLMQIWRMEAGGGNQEHVAREEANCWFPHVSPDGKWVTYVAYAKGDVAPNDHPPNKNVQVRIMAADGGGSRLLANLFGGQGTMNVNSWSPDSNHVAFVSYKV